MRRIGAIAAAVAAVLLVSSPVRGWAAERTTPSFALGVQTLFAQGWGPKWRDAVKAAEAPHVRDGLYWAKAEPAPGVYVFNPSTSGHLDWYRKQGVDVILTIEPKNPAYENGVTVQTDAGRRAYADYLIQILSRYSDVVYGIEIGNELNTPKGMAGVPEAAKPAAYAALLKTVYPAVKAKFPHVVIIGASTNVIGSGFIAAVFKAGAGPYMDAIAIHPYRGDPEGVEGEVAHLQALLRPYGPQKPVLATEFGNSFPRAADAAGFMVKMVCLLSDAGVSRAYWYTLRDEPWFQNQGLYGPNGEEKPALATFQMLQRALASGPPSRVDAGDPRTYVCRLGADTYAVWGAPRPISFTAGAEIRDPQGHAAPAPAEVSATPILVKGRESFSLGPPRVVADSLLDYGKPGWSYFAETADGQLHPLKVIDWTWTSYYGQPVFQPLRISSSTLAVIAAKGQPVSAVSRFTATRPQQVRIVASVVAGPKGDGVDLIVRRNGSILAQRHAHAETAEVSATASLKAGDQVDFVVTPGAHSAGDVVRQHFQLVAAE